MGLCSVLVLPSPKSQSQDVTDPSDRSLNWTVRGAVPVNESAEKDPTGKGIGVAVAVGVTVRIAVGVAVGITVGAPTVNAAPGVGVRLSPIPNSQATLARSKSTRDNAHLVILLIAQLHSPGR